METLHLLTHIPLFRGLDDEELGKISQLLVRRSFAEKTGLFLQGESLQTVYFIVSGKVKIYRNDESGREQVVTVLQEGDMFPHVGFFSTGVYPAHAVMIESGEMFTLSTERFRHLIESTPSLCLKLLAVIEHKYMELQSRLSEMVMHDTHGRLVLMLIRLSRLHGEPLEARTRLNIPITNQELANMIGTSRETVNRTLNQLKRDGAVETAPDLHLILDVGKLEQLL
ncbi:Crp/Fnr family transcriptional regulator [Tumebacillus sp. ITR2]|uniref:Crp/Fnr family transcriptional regulator n=1 Tax=Tumebacillus amylolyticus TaxID=2801339 RepID=A0ABS1JBE0_9BACL|nr:Crp/Fnr family transcriptional regulator [Tumebacillus amylolyticus]MBL0387587.1 Crp/Fnr family transcriptional regulator [Tumebacillus amylolyticus]